MRTMNEPKPLETNSLLITTEPSSRTVYIRRSVLAITLFGLAAYVTAIALGIAASPLATSTGGALPIAAATQSASVRPATETQRPPQRATEAAPTEPQGTGTETESQAEPVKPATPDARFVDLATTRILDTRERGAGALPLTPGGLATADVGQILPETGTNVAVLSVTVTMAQGPGPITVSIGDESIVAIDVAKAGQMTTSLILAPYVRGAQLTVATVGGGHLIVDLVGYFQQSGPTSAGRFVPVATQRIARLVTEIDGREAVVSPLANPALPASGVASVLVRITADVGSDGGMVRLGRNVDQLPNTMMWAATSGNDRTRQGVAVVSLSELDELALSYNGGSVLNLDVLGYFTDSSAIETDSGLFVPHDSAPITLEIEGGQSVVINVAEAIGVSAGQLGAVAVNVLATAEQPGQLYLSGPNQDRHASATVELGTGPRAGFTVTETDDDGSVVVQTDVDVSVSLILPGYFTR